MSKRSIRKVRHLSSFKEAVAGGMSPKDAAQEYIASRNVLRRIRKDGFT